MPAKYPLRIPAFVWIGAFAAIAAAPLLLLGDVWGYDFDFNTSMWMNAAEQFRHGILLPHWADMANAGFGEPSFIFYPPLSWMAGGLLGLILPWRFTPFAYVFLALALAGAAMWKLAKYWLEPRDALLACLLYVCNPYVLVNIYKRCDYGEFLACALFPLLISAAIRIGRDGRRTILPLAAIFAAIWLADLPAAMVASYSLALLLAVQSVLDRSFKTALLGAAAILGAFAGVAFFLLPAIWERQWVDIKLVFLPTWSPENNFMFTPSVEPILALYSRGISYIAVLLALTASAAAALSGPFRRRQPGIWYSLVALGGASAFLLFRPSWILWQILPALRYVEFPSRWLTPLAAATAVLSAAAIADFKRRKLFAAVAVAGFGVLSLAMMFTVHWDMHGSHIDELSAEARDGRGFRFTEGKDWRLPLGSHPSRLPDFAPLVTPAEDAQGVRIDIGQWSPERKVFAVDSSRPTLLKIKLLNYPAWQARLNGRSGLLLTDPDTGQMLLPVAAGFSRAEITFTRTWDRTAGMAVSCVSLLVLTLAVWRRRRRP